MPIIKSAKKAVRQTKKRTKQNKSKKLLLKAKLAQFGKSKTKKSLSEIFSLADKLTKAGIIHKNKAKRIKSRVAKMITPASAKKSS